MRERRLVSRRRFLAGVGAIAAGGQLATACHKPGHLGGPKPTTTTTATTMPPAGGFGLGLFGLMSFGGS